MFGIASGAGWGFHSIALGPAGLYASPGWSGELDSTTLRAIVDRLRSPRTSRFVWNVRFDQEALANGLGDLGIPSRRTSTHVLSLTEDYDRVFAGYHDTLRLHVRRARRRGVAVREATDRETLDSYYQVHEALAERTGGYGALYTVSLFEQLLGLKDTMRLLVAEVEGRLIGGAILARDGHSLLYWHGAADRDYSRYYPGCALLDEAIRGACAQGARFFNFGNSLGIDSLERFKASWGSTKVWNWKFEWENPVWSFIRRVRRRIQRAYAG
jgi:lipid II:glycine glycyltransferase (peptidoglycan interpeptide bridge formation enzyme)